jgi:hypothetical protein
MVKLCEMQSELKSCREIIRIPQEEIQDISSTYQPTGNIANETHITKNRLIQQEVKNGLTLINSKYISTILKRKSTTTSPRNFKSFPPLANLNEDSKHPRYVPHVKRYQSSRDRLQTHRPVKPSANYIHMV